MKSKLPSIILFVACVPTFLNLHSQTVDSNLNSNDSSRVTFLNSWLGSHQLELIHFTAIVAKGDKIEVEGTIPGKSAWVEATEKFSENNQMQLEEFLFRKVCIQFANDPKNITLELEGKNAYVFITGTESSVTYDLQERMDNVKDSFYIPIQDIKTVGDVKEFEAKSSFDKLQNKIIAGLQAFFFKYKVDVVAPEYTPIPMPYKDELIIDVRKIKKAAIERPISWEKYNVVINFKKTGGKLRLYLNINGAFGPGIGNRETLNYYDLQQYHPQAMAIFSAKIISEIQKILTTP